VHDRISRGPTDEFAVETSDLYRKLLELLPDPSRADSLDTKPTVDALRFLASASRVLGSSLNYHNTLANVARLAVPYIADWCVVDIVTEDGSAQQVALRPQQARVMYDRLILPIRVTAHDGVVLGTRRVDASLCIGL